MRAIQCKTVGIAIVSVVLLLCFAMQAQDSAAPSRGASIRAESPGVTNQGEIAALQADITKMRALLNQMEATFPLVGSTTSPVNHELELNIEMWRVVLNQMDRRTQRMQKSGPEKVTPSR
jgi:hypothetical protein